MNSRSTRDRGLRQISSATRWLAVGALAGGAVLSAVVANTLPGHSAATPSSAGSGGAVGGVAQSSPAGTGGGSAASGSQSGSGPAAADPGSSGQGLSGPAQLPQPVQAPPQVSSGGS